MADYPWIPTTGINIKTGTATEKIVDRENECERCNKRFGAKEPHKKNEKKRDDKAGDWKKEVRSLGKFRFNRTI